MLDIPVVLIIFNRPDTTARVFAEIAKARPRKLLVVADGPRPDRPGEAEKCAVARSIIESVDWNCVVQRNYSDVNLGCGHRPATGISWAYEHVDEAIILEDDCVPHPTFFRFCEELLKRYRDDTRIMHIGGSNFQSRQKRNQFSYFFSRHNVCFGGWATWRRAWNHFDMAAKPWSTLRDTSWPLEIVGSRRAAEYWRGVFDHAHFRGGDVDYWDHQWTLACWSQDGLSILPTTNLISNVGFREDATHTKVASDRRAFLTAEEMLFPLRHPPLVVQDRDADRRFINDVVLPSIPKRRSLYHKLRDRYSVFIAEHPSLRNPYSFYRRLLSKCSAIAARRRHT